MKLSLNILFALVLIGGLHAESRTWKSADGKTSISGELASHDTRKAVILGDNGKTYHIDLKNLCEDDRKWLTNKDAPDPNAVWDTLCFGDSRDKVEAKLKASKLVETQVDETFFGRFGLNGTFRTKEKIGGLHCELFFDWTAAGNLKEVSLRTQPQDANSYDANLRKNWSQLSELLSTLHGKPLQQAGYPDCDDLKNDVFLGSHLWRLNGGGSVLLGTSMQASKYMVVVRFTTEKIQPVLTP